MSGPTFAQLLSALPDDPAPAWPALPDRPVAPGPGWGVRRTEGSRHPVWTSTERPDDLAAAWLERRAAYERTGLWPLLAAEGFWEAVEIPGLDPPGDPHDWTARELLRGLVDGVESEPGYGPERGPAPTVAPRDEPAAEAVGALVAVPGGPSELVLVPTRAPWVVPELLGWDGAVNHDVLGREHTAVLGRWHGLFGAELVGLSRDVMTLLVARPPATPEARLAAATEVYAYCPDAVEQGVGTLDALTELTAGPGWALWWD